MNPSEYAAPRSPGTDYSLQIYIRRRFERLVKLSREVVKEAMEIDQWPAPGPVRHRLKLIALYADLLAQAQLDGRYSRMAERSMLSHLEQTVTIGSGNSPKLRRLAESFEPDWVKAHLGTPLRLNKRTAIDLPEALFQQWVQWVSARPAPRRGWIACVLSRALPDAALIGRILGLPVRHLCYSRHRLTTAAAFLLDIDETPAGGFGEAFLVDAHSETGITLAHCLEALQGISVNVREILLTSYDGSIAIPQFCPAELDQHGWAALRPLQQTSVDNSINRKPLLVALAGLPGSGKTLARKTIAERTGWSAVKWSKGVRLLLSEQFGGLSIHAVRALTAQEMADPEFVAREFLVADVPGVLRSNSTVVVDGIKSPAALQYVSRHLGRDPVIVAVERSPQVRSSAVLERRDFDDSADEERLALLHQLGLGELLRRAAFRIDMTDSKVKRDTGEYVLGAGAYAMMDELVACLSTRSLSAMVRNVTTGFLLLAPAEPLFLVLRSARSKDKWTLPGGHLEHGENLWEAACRELKEETGIAQVLRLEGCPPFVVKRGLWQGNDPVETKETTFFVARAATMTVQLSSEHCESRWVDAREALVLLSRPTNLLPLRALTAIEALVAPICPSSPARDQPARDMNG